MTVGYIEYVSMMKKFCKSEIIDNPHNVSFISDEFEIMKEKFILIKKTVKLILDFKF